MALVLIMQRGGPHAEVVPAHACAICGPPCQLGLPMEGRRALMVPGGRPPTVVLHRPAVVRLPSASSCCCIRGLRGPSVEVPVWLPCVRSRDDVTTIGDCLASESHNSHLPLLQKDSALEMLCVQEVYACNGCCTPYSLESQKRGFPPLRLFNLREREAKITCCGVSAKCPTR